MTTFLTIAQVAEATGLSTHTLRYYERIGLLDSVQRRDNGHRVFRAEDMTWLAFLLRLRDTGMPIAQMLQYAALRRQGDSLESVSARQRLLELHAGGGAACAGRNTGRAAREDRQLRRHPGPDCRRRKRAGFRFLISKTETPIERGRT